MKRWNEWRRNYLQWCQRHEKKRMRSKKTLFGMFIVRFVPILILTTLVVGLFLYSEYEKEKYWRLDEDEMQENFHAVPMFMKRATSYLFPYGSNAAHTTAILGDNRWLCAMGKEELLINQSIGVDGDWFYYEFLSNRICRAKDSSTYSVLVTYQLTEGGEVTYSYQIPKKQLALAQKLEKNPDLRIRSGWLTRGTIIIESYESTDGEIYELSMDGFDLNNADSFCVPTDGDDKKLTNRFAGIDASYGRAGGEAIAIPYGVVKSGATVGVDWELGDPDYSYMLNNRWSSISELRCLYDSYKEDEQNDTYYLKTNDSFGKKTYVGAYFQRINGKDYGFYVTGTNTLRWSYYFLMFGGIFGGALFVLLLSFILSEISYRRYKIDHDIYEYRMVLSNSMAHDLKSPLMVISGQAENLKETDDPEKRQEYADGILHQVSYMNELIADVLELYKTENLDAEKNDHVGLRECIQEQAEYFRDMISEKQLSIKVSGEKTISCDSSIRTMLRNLMENAVVHSPQEDTIQATIHDKGFSIENSLEQELSCEPKELLKPFVKGDSARSGRKGNGLGLSIAKSICDAHGYRIKVNVEDGKFRVSILF